MKLLTRQLYEWMTVLDWIIGSFFALLSPHCLLLFASKTPIKKIPIFHERLEKRARASVVLAPVQEHHIPSAGNHGEVNYFSFPVGHSASICP